MFLGYQNDKIVLIAETREKLISNKCLKFTSIVESEDNYTLYNGKYLTDEELAAAKKESRKEEIIAELSALDSKTIRSVRAELSGTATAEDRQYLISVENKVQALRQELRELEG